MAPKSNSETKDLTNKDGNITKLTEWATQDADSVDAMIEMFSEQGVSYSTGEEVTHGYRLITADEKVAFCRRIVGKRLFVARWEFRESPTGTYITMHIMVDDAGKFIVNDSSKTGFFGQLDETTSVRMSNGQSESQASAGLLVERGIKENKAYQYDTRTKKAIPRGADVPAEFRADAKPTFRFEL